MLKYYRLKNNRRARLFLQYTLNVLVMKLGPQLIILLNKIYEPSSTIDTVFNRHNLIFKTDEKGRPILAFIGTKDSSGKIKGERFARRLLTDQDGKVIKDHWDNKGKV